MYDIKDIQHKKPCTIYPHISCFRTAERRKSRGFS